MSLGLKNGAPTVAVVGGGLSGLAATVALTEAGCRVELFESRRTLGGRAGSFRDPATGELIDHCQHVSMGCCTNLADFCRRTGIADFFRRDRTLVFVGPEGKQYSFAAVKWLPAPLHLVPAFLRLGYLRLGDKIQIARALWKLMRLGRMDADVATVGQWLRDNGQSQNAISCFWSVILVSALGEDLDRASLSAARKVILDGFVAAHAAYEVEVPEAPLGRLYGERLENWLTAHNVALHLATPIRQVSWHDGPVVERADGQRVRADFTVIALPWSKIGEVVSPEIAIRWPWLVEVSRIEASPITGVHLWFDRPIFSLPHAAFVNRTSQWIFNRTGSEGTVGENYYQVVISASRGLAGKDREAVVAEVRSELAAIWPAASAAKLLRARVVTEHAAVFSVQPGLDRLRPDQKTSLPGLLVAGDWTNTGWPATMEGAVRSGYLAAESILRSAGREPQIVVPDLARGLLARLLIRN